MRLKIDYVTNSSSASFMIPREKVNDVQLSLIENHIEAAKMFMTMYPDDRNFDFGYLGRFDDWKITVTEDTVEGDTSMDNFDLYHFLRVIGIKDEDVDYDPE